MRPRSGRPRPRRGWRDLASQTLKADRDAYVDEASPDSNFGGGSRLYVRSQGGILGDGDRRVYCSFDLADLPADAAEVLTATLRLTPEEASLLERTLRCHEVTGAWTESGITWNTQPTVDTDHGAQLSTDDPQDWDVLSTVQTAFPGGRAEFRVKDENEGSADGPEQAYISREGIGTEPELVITFKREANGDLASTVTPNNNRVADLATTLTARAQGEPFQGVRTVQPLDALDGDPIEPNSIAYDPGRDLLWITDTVEIKVHRVKLDGTTDQTHELPQPGSSGMGVTHDGTDLWFTTGSDLQRWSIQADGITHEETITLEGDETAEGLAWDGSHLWTIAGFAGEVHKRASDGSKLRTVTVDDVEDMAFTDGHANPFLLEGPGDDRQIVERDIDTFAEVDRWDSALANAIESLTFEKRDREVAAWIPDWQADQLHRFPALTLPSTVTVGNLIGDADLATTVQPANIPATSDLASQVLPGNGAQADLAATVTAQPIETADLASTVQPAGLSGASDLTTTVRPATSETSTQGRVTGSVAPVIVVDSDDFAEISAEIGSEITHTQDGSSTSLRRVVQLVDTQTSKTFPREVTSEHGRSSTHDSLGRGDAILYAKQGDRFQPGDTVDYDGLTWEVIGLLGWELVGDERVYQEVGLRRLSITAQARAQGTVQLSNAEDLLSEVNVP